MPPSARYEYFPELKVRHTAAVMPEKRPGAPIPHHIYHPSLQEPRHLIKESERSVNRAEGRKGRAGVSKQYRTPRERRCCKHFAVKTQAEKLRLGARDEENSWKTILSTALLPSSPQARTFDAGGTTKTPISFKEVKCLRRNKKTREMSRNEEFKYLLRASRSERTGTAPALGRGLVTRIDSTEVLLL